MQEINRTQTFTNNYYKTGYVGNGPGQARSTASPQPEKVSHADETGKTGKPAEESTERSISGKELNDDEQRRVEKLRQRDRKVRSHENAHAAAAGPYKRGGTRFSYKTGPDGKQYAVSGNVSVDMGSESTPEATIAKMKTVQRAAIAPQDPSAKDRATYSAAVRREMNARQALREEKRVEQKERREQASGDSEKDEYSIGTKQAPPLTRTNTSEPPETSAQDAKEFYNRQDISKSSHGQTARLDFQG